jgi:hypothetical protein
LPSALVPVRIASLGCVDFLAYSRRTNVTVTDTTNGISRNLGTF